MRVICQSIDEFIECLENERHLFQDTIRVNIVRRPHDGNVYEATKFFVVLQASAVVYVGEGSEYLLEVGEECGRDIEDAQPERVGTEMAKACKLKVEEYAEKRGWKVLPGMIHI